MVAASPGRPSIDPAHDTRCRVISEATETMMVRLPIDTLSPLWRASRAFAVAYAAPVRSLTSKRSYGAIAA